MQPASCVRTNTAYPTNNSLYNNDIETSMAIVQSPGWTTAAASAEATATRLARMFHPIVWDSARLGQA
eukprot:361816-Chlamydomonas_euryale.AAC.2